MARPWLAEEIEYIKKNAAALTDKELHLHINSIYKQVRSFDMVRKMRQRLGIEKGHGRGVCKVTGQGEVTTKVENKLKKKNDPKNKYK